MFIALVLIAFRTGGSPDALRPRPAPGFELPLANGEMLALSELAGKPVLINFWASWCPPCIEETPSLEAMSRLLGPKGLVVLGVTVDETWPVVQQVVDRFGISYPVLLDASGSTPRRYGTYKYPESYFVDSDGRIVRRFVGAVNWMRPDVVAELEALVAQSKASRTGSGAPPG